MKKAVVVLAIATSLNISCQPYFEINKCKECRDVCNKMAQSTNTANRLDDQSQCAKVCNDCIQGCQDCIKKCEANQGHGKAMCISKCQNCVNACQKCVTNCKEGASRSCFIGCQKCAKACDECAKSCKST